MADALFIASAIVVLAAFNEWRYGRFLRQQKATLVAIEKSLGLLRGALREEFAERRDPLRDPGVAAVMGEDWRQ